MHARRAQLEILCKKYPHRDSEIRSICSYLDPVFENAPALLVTGATGCGKTDICRDAVRVGMYPHRAVYVLCSGYVSTKQLIKALWYKLIFELATASGAACRTSSGGTCLQRSGEGDGDGDGDGDEVYPVPLQRSSSSNSLGGGGGSGSNRSSSSSSNSDSGLSAAVTEELLSKTPGTFPDLLFHMGKCNAMYMRFLLHCCVVSCLAS